MAELLKNGYNDKFFTELTEGLSTVYPSFNSHVFLTRIYDDEWKNRELKERMHHIAIALHEFLPQSFQQSVDIIVKLVQHLKKHRGESFEYMFLPDFIEKYGLDDFEIATTAFEEITQFTSCEFAVRPFIVKYPQKMMAQMLLWSKHKHPSVRRLATEGCRPRLPWAMGFASFKKDPKEVVHILENLKDDPSESVRRSVANNLNDISKDNPAIVVELIRSWQGRSKETDWVIRHGCRTLLKQGHSDILEFFGLASTSGLSINTLKIHNPKLNLGEDLLFSFQLTNSNQNEAKIRLEYGIYYQKANESLARKVFHISEKAYPAQSKSVFNQKRSFKPITTRTYHKGLHQLAIILNGEEQTKVDFHLI